jgi:pyruvate carboxylase
MKLHNRLPRTLCGQNRKNNSEFFSFPVLIYLFFGGGGKSQKIVTETYDLFSPHHHNGKLSFACGSDEEFFEQLNNPTLKENIGSDTLKFSQRRC